MKKTVFVLFFVMSFIIIPLSAATSAGSGDENQSGDGEGSAGVKINFDLSSGANSSWEIGFTGDISGLKNNGTTVSPLDSDSVALIIGEGTSGTLKDDLYVYWIIKGGQKLNITLAADDALKGSSQTGSETADVMNWKTEWTPSASGPSESQTETKTSIGTTVKYTEGQLVDYTTALPVFTREVLDQSLETGYAQLTITTQDITDVAPVNYSANLTLKITPVETT